MPSEKRKIGDIGEKIAEKWLNDKGFSILDRNYLKKWGEIDIVAKNKGIYRFIEVKTISREIAPTQNGVGGADEYRPEENVHPAKLKRLHRTIESYLIEKNILQNDSGQVEGEWQLDVVTVHLDIERKLAKVNILENIVG